MEKRERIERLAGFAATSSVKSVAAAMLVCATLLTPGFTKTIWAQPSDGCCVCDCFFDPNTPEICTDDSSPTGCAEFCNGHDCMEDTFMSATPCSQVSICQRTPDQVLPAPVMQGFGMLVVVLAALAGVGLRSLRRPSGR
jgi:hypothetical protein